jgi:lysophospholipase L1-like esterase
MKSQAKRVVVRAGQVVRDGWLILGITLLFIVLLESGYRAVAIIGGAIGRDAADPRGVEPSNPLDTLPWWPAYKADHLREEEVRWTPYVYIRNPTFAGTHMTVDSLGRRVTPFAASVGGPAVRVFFYGGSTTFGWFQRDSFTIPAVAAQRLQNLVGDRASVTVTNFGVPGHTFTQEILELLLQLRAGARPDVVVFYDGINDAMATVQNGRAGIPQNEWNREADFERGRQLAREYEPGLHNDVRTSLRSARAIVGRLQFVRRLTTRPANATGGESGATSDSLARHLVRTFASNAQLVEALADRYGFEPIYVWQPALLATAKNLTPRERWLRTPSGIGELHRAVPALIGQAMTPVVGERFIDATSLFDGDSLEVFADLYGHTYERANPRIVDTLMTRLGPAVQRAAARARTAGR